MRLIRLRFEFDHYQSIVGSNVGLKHVTRMSAGALLAPANQNGSS
jgi:hypothetical protein